MYQPKSTHKNRPLSFTLRKTGQFALFFNGGDDDVRDGGARRSNDLRRNGRIPSRSLRDRCRDATAHGAALP